MFNQSHIHALPAFQNNFLWLLQNDEHAILVDPGDAQVCIDALTKHSLQLDAVLITHHHNDHIGGLTQIQQKFSCPVYGPDDSRINFVTHKLAEGAQMQWRSFQFDVWHTPGHTNSHIIYWEQNAALLFCGDMLFGAGCGRHMEGDIKDLYHSLQRIAALPDHTAIYCAHEYTLQNLQFALHLEPENPLLLQRIAQATQTRAAELPTIPTNIRLERETNPFLRSHLPGIRKKLDSMKSNSDIRAFLSPFNFHSEDEYYFALMRSWKNIYV
jgi:hydroxyacylglutathione hydrolase